MPNTVVNPITGIADDIRGPDSAIGSGGRYTILELGAFDLTASAADMKLHAMPRLQRGRVITMFAKVITPTTDANADGTITLEINGTAITGGVITVADTADGTNPFITTGKIFQSTLITADNKFDGNDYIDIAWATTNTFIDGRVAVFLVIEYGLNS